MQTNKKQASNEYHVDYNRRKYKRFEIVFDKEKDRELIEFLVAIPNRAVWIKSLIRKAFENDRK